MPTRPLLVFFTGVYAFVYAAVLVSSVGDADRQLNVAGWFSWHAVFLVVLASSASLRAPSAGGVIATSIIHFVGAAAATLQSLGFFIWALVLWSRDKDSPFLGLIAAALGAQALVGVPLVLLTVRNMFLARRGSNGGDLVATVNESLF